MGTEMKMYFEVKCNNGWFDFLYPWYGLGIDRITQAIRHVFSGMMIYGRS
jgi:hypothetical protein